VADPPQQRVRPLLPRLLRPLRRLPLRLRQQQQRQPHPAHLLRHGGLRGRAHRLEGDTPEAHVFKADVPGLKKEEVKVEVEDGNILQISGERNKEQEEKTDTWHRVERSSGKFLRRFRLPENAKAEQVKASMENGVLTVTVPKEEAKKPEVKSIQISG
uniref:SHSP domain-containing protein n=1 Tax=Aegilops tauschii subsp. strangulata TaxID=200361 RepID=A0A453IF27_AEGTS